MASKKNVTYMHHGSPSERGLKKVTGIKFKWKLFLFLIVFVVFSLLVVWFFQVVMVNTFYKRARHRDVEQAVEYIELAIKNDSISINDASLQCANDYRVCVRVFNVIGSSITELASVEGTGECFLHYFSNDEISKLIDRSVKNSGVYVETLRFSEPSSKRISSEIYVRTFKVANEGTYAVMLNTNLLPVSSVVNTMNVQFLWIAILLIIGAFILALVISKYIVKPVSDINESARLLSLGEYDVTFPDKGCLEVKELAATLNQAADELSKNELLKRELIANISHDLRTPLTLICGYAEVMRDIPEENNAENMQVIIDEATRMSELVKDILDLSKIQAGARLPSAEVFNLTETIEEVLRRYTKLTEHHDYVITFNHGSSVEVYADKSMMLQVVYNLVNNAINYCGDDKRIEVRQTVDDGNVRISVIDNGDGIEPDMIPHIWNRYYKVDKVHKQTAIGAGLGLSIVKEILEQHDASYGVSSTPGVGSSFWFELKIQSEE